jgi:hypothetical protein
VTFLAARLVSHDVGISVLVIQRDATARKRLRNQLSQDYVVLAVNSIGEAMARLRSHSYDLVACTDRSNSMEWSEDYGLLVDTNGLLAKQPSVYELYLPGIRVRARAVLIVPATDLEKVESVIRQAAARLAPGGAALGSHRKAVSG